MRPLWKEPLSAITDSWVGPVLLHTTVSPALTVTVEGEMEFVPRDTCTCAASANAGRENASTKPIKRRESFMPSFSHGLGVAQRAYAHVMKRALSAPRGRGRGRPRRYPTRFFRVLPW